MVASLHTCTQKHTQELLEKICSCCVRQRRHIAELILGFGATFLLNLRDLHDLHGGSVEYTVELFRSLLFLVLAFAINRLF